MLEIHILSLVESERCTTPDRKQGDCKNIRQCEPLLKILRKRPLANSEADFLRRSQCGFEGSDPKVCCPSEQSSEPTPSQENVGTVEGL